MSKNAIPSRQNEPEALRLLGARSEVYRQAVRIQVTQLLLTVFVPFVGAIVGLAIPAARPYVATLAIVITLIDIAVLDRAIKHRLKTAALVCEAFDCHILDIPWNRFTAGRPLEPEAISAAARRWPQQDHKLINWYPVAVGAAPLYLARIVCQRTNLWYDATLRQRYSDVLVIAALLIVIVLVMAGAAANLPFIDFVVTIFAPSAPILSWALRDSFKQRDAAGDQKVARAEAEALWDIAVRNECAENECAHRSRELQNTIFQRRASSPLLFPLLYRRLRQGMEVDMNVGAVDLLRQAGIDPIP